MYYFKELSFLFMDNLIQSLCLEKKPQTWEQQVELEEAGHVMPHLDRHWDLSLQSMTLQIPTHSFFGAQTHLTFHRQWKRTLYGAKAILSLCQQQCGPQHSARDVCIGPEKFLIRQHTSPVSPQGPCLFWCWYSKVQKRHVQLLHFSAGKFKLSLPQLCPMERGWGGGGDCRAESTRSCLPSMLFANVERSLTNRSLIKTLYSWIQEASSH